MPHHVGQGLVSDTVRDLFHGRVQHADVADHGVGRGTLVVEHVLCHRALPPDQARRAQTLAKQQLIVRRAGEPGTCSGQRPVDHPARLIGLWSHKNLAPSNCTAMALRVRQSVVQSRASRLRSRLVARLLNRGSVTHEFTPLVAFLHGDDLGDEVPNEQEQ